MTGNIYGNITTALSSTDVPLPYFKYKLFEVRHMIFAWNEYTRDVFITSWVSCLDESINIWTKTFTFPIWMFPPRKAYPKVNEYHTI